MTWWVNFYFALCFWKRCGKGFPRRHDYVAFSVTSFGMSNFTLSHSKSLQAVMLKHFLQILEISIAWMDAKLAQLRNISWFDFISNRVASSWYELETLILSPMSVNLRSIRCEYCFLNKTWFTLCWKTHATLIVSLFYTCSTGKFVFQKSL